MNRRLERSGTRSARLRAVVLLAALGGCLLPVAPASAATRYVFAVFKGDGSASEKLSIYTSTDGLNFTLLSDTGYGGPTGILRDPSIMKHSDGKYYVAHTTNSWTTTTTNFAIASSTDLVKWTHVVTVDAQVANVKDTWAPEWFKDSDGSINLIVNIDTGNSDFRAYKFTATDDTLTKWSTPVTIGIGPNYIDTFIVKVGSTYNAFSKNETTKYIEHATASSLTGPWTWVGTGDWAGWGSGKEGPALFQLDSGQWRIFLDCYSGCGYLYGNSSGGDLGTWSSTSTVPGGLSGVVRHGTVLREGDPVDAGPPDSGGLDSSADVAKRDMSTGDASGADGVGSGGAKGSGGATASGGATGSGGVTGNGGATGSVGVKGTGGLTGTGGTTGKTSSAGTAGIGGPAGTGGTSGGGGTASTMGQPDAAIARDAASAGNPDAVGVGGSGGNAGADAPSNRTGSSQGCSCRMGSGETNRRWPPLALELALLALCRRRKQLPLR